MTRRGTLLAVVVALLVPTWLGATTPPSVSGKYLGEDRDHAIALYLKGQRLFGAIIWTKDPNLKDSKNPDPKLRQRKLVGLEHIWNFKRTGEHSFGDGELYNPEDGQTYRASIVLLKDGRLRIEGRPNVPLIGSWLGALFGRIYYTRWQPTHAD